MKRKLAVDIDNTIWDLVSSWIEYYNNKYDDNVKASNITKYAFFDLTKKATKEEMFDILCVDDFWSTVNPYRYSEEYLRKLNKEFDLYIVTSTSYKTSRKKFERFFELFPFLDEHQLIITHHKEIIDVDIIVDDCPINLTNTDHIRFLINQSYNKSVKDESIIRVNDLREVYYYFFNTNNNK
jgi:5'(3')-deoxyribonucleotidase